MFGALKPSDDLQHAVPLQSANRGIDMLDYITAVMAIVAAVLSLVISIEAYRSIQRPEDKETG